MDLITEDIKLFLIFNIFYDTTTFCGWQIFYVKLIAKFEYIAVGD